MSLALPLAVLLAFASTLPQDTSTIAVDDSPAAAQEQAADEMTEAEALDGFIEALGGVRGPARGELGTLAAIEVPEGYFFAGAEGTQRFLEMSQNPTNGNELGLLMPTASAENWFVCFSFVDAGYIKDDERDELDADALLTTLREGNEAGNEARKERGWSTLELVGWEKPPFYDAQSNNLTWATRARGGEGESVNWSTRLLGRNGYMNVDLVLAPESLAATLPQFQTLLAGFTYNSGHRYAEFTSGDKVAEYGLAALVAGGAGVAAAKTGLLAKFWKLIVAAVVAVGAFGKKIWSKLGPGGATERDATG